MARSYHCMHGTRLVNIAMCVLYFLLHLKGDENVMTTTKTRDVSQSPVFHLPVIQPMTSIIW